MGSRMAINLVNAGHHLSVWNRNKDRAKPLTDLGAQYARSPREAAIDADFVISMLTDNEASKTVWCDSHEGALAGMKPGSIAIECSTLTVEWVKELNEHCTQKNIGFLDAPVAGSRPQAEAAQLIFFVGGNKPTFNQALPVLQIMGNAIHPAGAASAGTSIKLAVNALFGIQVATMAELIRLFKTTGVDVNHATEILMSTPVCSPAAKLAANAMLIENFAPMFPISLVKKDFTYALAAVSKKTTAQEAPMIHAGQNVFKEAINKGYGDNNITGVAQLYV